MGTGPAASGRRRTALLLALCIGVCGAVVVVLLNGGERATVVAEQYGAPVVTVGSADARAWVALAPETGVLRDGWPTPMTARDTEFCFGFGRVDFTPPRPAVARCIDARELPTVPPNGIVPVMMIKAGLDNWHVLITGSDAEEFELMAAGSGPLPQDRIHIFGDVVVLRLPADLPVDEVSWVNGRTRYACISDLDAAATGGFCAATTGATTAPERF